MFEEVIISSVKQIPRKQTSPTIYRLHTAEGLWLSMLIKIKANSEKIVFLFNGAYNPNLSTTPNFMRWSWAEKAHISYIIVDDPLVSCVNKTNIGWYIGTKHFDLQSLINQVVQEVCKNCRIKKINTAR